MTQAKSENKSTAFQFQFEFKGFKFGIEISNQAIAFAILAINFLSTFPKWLQAILGFF